MVFRKIPIVLIAFCLLLVISLPILGAGYQPLAVEPSLLQFTCDPGDQITGSIQVTNKGSEATTPRALLNDWTLNLNNQLEVMDSGVQNSSLDEVIKFNPRQFQLEPGQTQTVRFTVRIPKDAQVGEYRGMICFEQIVPYEGSGMGATAKLRVASTIYVAIPPIERKSDIVDIKIRTNFDDSLTQVALTLKGTGSAHFRGNGAFRIFSPGSEKPIAEGSFEPIVLLPETTTQFSGEWAGVLAPGRYHIAIEIVPEDSSGQLVQQVYEFTQQES